MRIEAITPAVLPIILSWWPARDQGTMQPHLLPPVGCVAIDDEGPAAAAWLYKFEGCQAGQLDWFVGRPGMGMKTAREAGRMVLQGIEKQAREAGIRTLFGAACLHPIVREAEACGFVVTVPEVVHFAKQL